MKLSAVSTVIQFKSHKSALDYAKNSLLEGEYQEIKHSYDMIFKNTLLFIFLVCIPIMIICEFIIFNAPFSKMNLIEGAAEYVDARIDYDDNFYWTYNSKVFKYPLNDYGMNSDEYVSGDRVRVYLDENKEIIAVTPMSEYDARKVEVLSAFIGCIAIPVVLLVFVHYPIAKRTYGKKWYEFYSQFK